MLRWIIDNLLAEIIFGAILLPLSWWKGKFLYNYFIKSRQIVSILSIRNNPNRRIGGKGIYATDRFMQIYEAKAPLNSDYERPYGNGEGGGAYSHDYIDKYILERYGLVTVFEEGGRKKVKVNKNRITKMVYNKAIKKEGGERKRNEKYERERQKPLS